MSSQYVLNLSGLVVVLLSTASAAHAQDEASFNCGPTSGVIGEESDCIDASITYGTATILAGRFQIKTLAANPDEWRFSNTVTIVNDDAQFEADSAIVKLENGEIVFFELSGSPSRISLIVNEGEVQVSAEAGGITYDVANDMLLLTGDVRFVYGENVFHTCELTYNLNKGSYTTGECGFRLTLPQTETEPDRSTPQRDEP